MKKIYALKYRYWIYKVNKHQIILNWIFEMRSQDVKNLVVEKMGRKVGEFVLDYIFSDT